MAEHESAREQMVREVEMTETGLPGFVISPPPAISDDANEYGMDVETRGQWATVVHRFVHDKRAMFGFVVFMVIVIACVIYNVLNPTKYTDITDNILAPPSWSNLFGTDELGTSMLAKVLKGTLQDIQVAVVVAVMAVVIGTIVGAVAGFYGGKIDNALMRFVDLILVVPVIVVLILLANLIAGSGNNWLLLAVIIGALAWTYIARLVRATLLSLREREFVEAARALGASDRRIIAKHLIPNSVGPIIVNATITVAGAIGLEATLSFLGLGVQPPAVSLGLLIQLGQTDATTYWWLFVFPVAFLLLIILCVFFIGDGLQNALDPKKNRVRA